MKRSCAPGAGPYVSSQLTLVDPILCPASLETWLPIRAQGMSCMVCNRRQCAVQGSALATCRVSQLNLLRKACMPAGALGATPPRQAGLIPHGCWRGE